MSTFSTFMEELAIIVLLRGTWGLLTALFAIDYTWIMLLCLCAWACHWKKFIKVDHAFLEKEVFGCPGHY